MNIKPSEGSQWDLVSLGEVMLRLDPGEGRIHTTRSFQAWEGGGEYNVARGLKRCFGWRSGVVTALVDNPVGRLIEDLMYQGGVDTSFVKWVESDGLGRKVRNGLNFTERGYGLRAAVGCSDRGHSAASQLTVGDIDWDAVFGGAKNARWLHTGGIYAALSSTTPEFTAEAMRAAQKHDARVSYDLNYRPSLWKDNGGQQAAQRVNRELVSMVDVLFGNEEDFSAALGFEIEGVDESFTELDVNSYKRTLEKVAAAYPNLKVIATSLRTVHHASLNAWGAVALVEGEFVAVPQRDLFILDRVGGGDSFASGLIHGLLSGKGGQWALECGVAHGALAMTTPGDTSMAKQKEVLAAMGGSAARIDR
jgi:2-dehydro-3-deoxygluconokinase